MSKQKISCAVLGLFLSAVSAFAGCPQIAGSYTCDDESVVITQTSSEFTMSVDEEDAIPYKISSEWTVIGSDDDLSVSTKAACTQKTVNLDIQLSNGSQSIEVYQRFTPKSDGGFTLKTDVAGESEEVDCIKAN